MILFNHVTARAADNFWRERDRSRLIFTISCRTAAPHASGRQHARVIIYCALTNTSIVSIIETSDYKVCRSIFVVCLFLSPARPRSGAAALLDTSAGHTRVNPKRTVGVRRPDKGQIKIEQSTGCRVAPSFRGPRNGASR